MPQKALLEETCSSDLAYELKFCWHVNTQNPNLTRPLKELLADQLNEELVHSALHLLGSDGEFWRTRVEGFGRWTHRG